jgi:carboxypeptidase PM20D1
MSHYDVVPATLEDGWVKPPFSGEVVDGVIFGRGTLDTKCSLCAVMESVEVLIESNFTPECDIYLCFGGDEETTAHDAVAIARELKSRCINPFLILDEGSVVIELPESFQRSNPNMGDHVALVGIAEKGYIEVEFIARGPGGHTSMPVRENPFFTIAEVIRRLKNPFKPKISEPFRIMRNAIADRVNLKLKIALKNKIISTLLMPQMIKTIPDFGAIVQTTGTITLINGGSVPNVVPKKCCAVGNFRIISGSSVGETMNVIRKKLDGLDVEINLLAQVEPSKTSKTSGEGWYKLNAAITDAWGGNCTVVPYLMIGCTDSRSYSDISDNIYRFSPMILTKAERASIHGINEKITQDNYKKMIEFYLTLIKKL